MFDPVTIQLTISTVFILSGILLTSYAVIALTTRESDQPLSKIAAFLIMVTANSPIYAGVLILAVLNGAI